MSKLPETSEQLIVALICEELKSRRFFSTLQLLGLEDSPWQPNLDQLIMQGLGLNDANSTLDFYFRVMDEHAGTIGTSEESVHAQAKEVYRKLKSKA
jgi:hypothetical protein